MRTLSNSPSDQAISPAVSADATGLGSTYSSARRAGEACHPIYVYTPIDGSSRERPRSARLPHDRERPHTADSLTVAGLTSTVARYWPEGGRWRRASLLVHRNRWCPLAGSSPPATRSVTCPAPLPGLAFAVTASPDADAIWPPGRFRRARPPWGAPPLAPRHGARSRRFRRIVGAGSRKILC